MLMKFQKLLYYYMSLLQLQNGSWSTYDSATDRICINSHVSGSVCVYAYACVSWKEESIHV